MYSKFPFSMENIPRQRTCGCFSLRFGCILTALIVILYTVLALSQCIALLLTLGSNLCLDDIDGMTSFTLFLTMTMVHGVSFILTALMLVGVLRDKAKLIKPWVVWKSLKLIVSVLLFILWSTAMFDENSLLEYVIAFMAIIIQFYMLMLVSSYYKQVKDLEDESERLKSLVANEIWYEA